MPPAVVVGRVGSSQGGSRKALAACGGGSAACWWQRPARAGKAAAVEDGVCIWWQSGHGRLAHQVAGEVKIELCCRRVEAAAAGITSTFRGLVPVAVVVRDNELHEWILRAAVYFYPCAQPLAWR